MKRVFDVIDIMIYFVFYGKHVFDFMTHVFDTYLMS